VPIPGAEVSIAFVAEEKAQVLVPQDLQHPLATIKTGTLGAFSFTLDKFGHYLVRTNKAGGTFWSRAPNQRRREALSLATSRDYGGALWMQAPGSRFLTLGSAHTP
jgi:hypothetical protein